MKRYIKSAIVPISDEDSNIRKEIAKSTSGDDLTVDQLSSDKDRKVREQLAKNPNTPVDTLRKLSKDRSYKVRAAVAKNPNTPSEVLEEMVSNEISQYNNSHDFYQHNDVLEALIKNPNTSITSKLSIYTTISQYSNVSTALQCALARDKNTPTELIEKLINNYHISHQCIDLLAKHPNATPKQLSALYRENADVKILAQNPNTPASVLHKIFDDQFGYGSKSICKLVLQNPNLKGKLKSELSAKLSEELAATSLKPYVGKDIWLAGESYGISRDFPCYYKLVSVVDSKKKIYEVNLLYENINWNNPLERAMNETENYQLDDDSDDSNGKIYRPFESYTTEELLAKLYPTYEED